MSFKFKSLAVAVGLATSAIASPSYALLINSTVESSASIHSSYGVPHTEANGPGSSTQSDAINHYYSGSHATGDSSGNASLLSEGPWYAQISQNFSTPFDLETSSSVTFKATITNDAAFAKNIDFNFLVTGGRIASISTVMELGDYVKAGYSASISVNGTNKWASAAETVSDANGESVALSGVNLGGVVSGGGNHYKWENYSDTVNLGWLNPGESLTLEYELNTYINELFAHDGYSYMPHADIGDPFDFNSSPLFAVDKFVDAGSSSSVPEPSGLALIGAGLAGLAFRRRERKARA